MILSLRGYQQQAIDAANTAYDVGGDDNPPIQRSLIVLPTGCGKTITGLALAKERGDRTLWLAHTTELIDQPKKDAELVWPEVSHGIVRAESNQFSKHLVFASIQSASQPRRRLQLAGQRFGFVVVDEAHHALSDSYKNLLTELRCFDRGGPKLIGFTATPERSDQGALSDIFEGVVFQMGITEAIAQGYLVPPRVVSRPINLDLSKVTTSKGDYQIKALDVALLNAGIVEEICAAFHEHCAALKTIIFCVSVAQAESIAAKLKASGVAAAAVSGETDKEDRKEILRKFKDGRLQCVVNCMVLTEGFDEPSIQALILGRPTQSKALMIQKVGRGLRIFPGKIDCLVVDMVANTGRHDLIQAAVLFGADQTDEPRIIGERGPSIIDPEEYWRQRYMQQVQGVRGAPQSALNWLIATDKLGGYILGVGAYGTVRMIPGGDDHYRIGVVGCQRAAQQNFALSGVPVSFETASALGEDYVRRVKAIDIAQKDADWREQELSDAQKRKLKNAKVKNVKGISAGTAQDILDQVHAEKASKPASRAQIVYLKRQKITVPEKLTMNEARRLIGQSKKANRS